MVGTASTTVMMVSVRMTMFRLLEMTEPNASMVPFKMVVETLAISIACDSSMRTSSSSSWSSS